MFIIVEVTAMWKTVKIEKFQILEWFISGFMDFWWHWKVKSRSLGINLAVYHRQLDIISVA